MRTLLISDIHQDLKWLEDVLHKETWDRIIYMGDWFDSHQDDKNVVTSVETANFIKDLIDNNKDEKHTFLLGNHDVPYMETSQEVNLNGFTNSRTQHICSGFTKNKAKKINKIMTPKYWDHFEMFTYDQGFLISHAGIGMSLAAELCGKKIYGDVMDNLDEPPTFYEVLEALTIEERDILRAIKMHNYHPLLNVGDCRGGRGQGGMTWQDWDSEFNSYHMKNSQINPQIMGHTTKYESVRDNGQGSYCIDGIQTTYGIIEDGKFSHGLVKNKNSDEFQKKIEASEKRFSEFVDKNGLGMFMC